MEGQGRAVVQAAAAAVLWGSIGVAYRLGLEAGAREEWLIAGRALAAGAGALIALAAGLGRPTRWSLLVAVAALAPLYIVYPLAVSRIGAALASILLYTAPLWVIALSKPLLGEPPGGRGLAAAILGIAGAALIAGPTIASDPTGIALGLASGLAYGLYILLARLAQLRGATSLEVGVHPLPATAVAVAAYTRPEPPPTPVEALYSIYLGIAATLAPYALHTKALSRLEAYKVSLISLIEPLAAATLATAILGEKLTPTQILGGTLILTAAYTATKTKQHHTNKN